MNQHFSTVVSVYRPSRRTTLIVSSGTMRDEQFLAAGKRCHSISRQSCHGSRTILSDWFAANNSCMSGDPIQLSRETSRAKTDESACLSCRWLAAWTAFPSCFRWGWCKRSTIQRPRRAVCPQCPAGLASLASSSAASDAASGTATARASQSVVPAREIRTLNSTLQQWLQRPWCVGIMMGLDDALHMVLVRYGSAHSGSTWSIGPAYWYAESGRSKSTFRVSPTDFSS